MKSKLIFGLLAMTLILAFASASFAQINLQIFSSPSASENINKRTSQTGDPTSSGAGVTISGGVIANAELTATTLTLTFGAPITSSCNQGTSASCPGAVPGSSPPVAAVPANDPIQIVASTGLFAGITITSVRFAAGAVDIVLPDCKGACFAPLTSGSFRLVGVRVDVNGKTAPMTVTASLNNGGNNYILTRASDTTISALNVPITLTSPTATSTVFSNGTVNGTTKFTLSEGNVTAWRGNGFPGNSATNAGTTPNGDQILLKVSGLVTGETLSFTATTTGGTGFLFTPSGTTFTSATTSRSLVLSSTDMTKTETIVMTFTLTVGATATLPLALGSITITAQMGPVEASGLDGFGIPTAVNGFPGYADSNSVGPITLATVIPAQTTMLIPFAVYGGGYDTGIAIANTTADPFGAGFGATAQSGTITMDFYPQLATGGAGTPSTLTTSATIRPVTGLSSDGSLAAGGEWTVLLSGLLPLATPPITGSFTGYIFIRTNFLDAHGVFYPTDFKSFTAGSLMLNLAPPAAFPRNTAGTNPLGVEALNN